MLRTASQLVLVAGAVAVGAAGAMTLRADVLVDYGFSRALEARTGAPAFASATPVSHPEMAEVGDEAYWLTRGGTAVSPVVLGKRLALGDRIVVGTEDGRPRHLEVAAIQYVGSPVLQVADTPAAVRLMRVTLRAVDAAPGDKEELVHVLIEAPAPPKPAAAAVQRGTDRPSGRT